MDTKQLKQDLDIAYKELEPKVKALSDYIFANPETAFNEHKAVSYISKVLLDEGFLVDAPVGGLETAFTAVFEHNPKNDKKLTSIGIIAEYDALPEIGHACGHNLIAAAAFGAAVSLKQVMLNAGIPGIIKVIGTPAEEDGGGKIILLDAGIFEGLSVCMIMHPTSGVTRIAGECLSSHELSIIWKGKTAHAESHPEDGVNALDALHIYYTAVACLRQQLSSDVRIAQATIDKTANIAMIPAESKLLVEVVSEDRNLMPTVQKIKQCAEGAAIASGCTVSIESNVGYLGRLPNNTLGDLFKKNLSIIGEPVIDGMPADFGTTDFGNVMRCIPSCNPYVSLFTEKKISNHTEQFRELAHSERANLVLEIGTKVMAYSAMDLLVDNSLLIEATDEFEHKIEGM